MRGPETRLRIKIQKALAEAFPGSYFRKIHGNKFQNRGIPDLIGCVHGMFFGFEIKISGKKATPIQNVELKQIKKANGKSAVITSPQEAVKIVSDAIYEFEENYGEL